MPRDPRIGKLQVRNGEPTVVTPNSTMSVMELREIKREMQKRKDVIQSEIDRKTNRLADVQEDIDMIDAIIAQIGGP